MFDASINSGFTNGGDINISNRFTEITLLHQSGNGYSEVYKAKRYGQWHVLKCLTKSAAKEVQYQTLLEKEFKIAYPLSHPNIVRTLGIEEVDGLGTCIVQEYIDGEPVKSITREQAAELCDAVDYIHRAGVIHRDIKPENVLIRKDNKHLVLIDFGLADKVDFSVLKGGAGTSGYAAPEQWTGGLSPMIDVYGIGGILALNRRFRRIADKCRRKNPDKRYPSAQAIKKVVLRTYHWSWVIISILIAGLAYVSYVTYTSNRSSNYHIAEQQEKIEGLQDENALLDKQLEQMQQDYRHAERTIQNLQEALGKEHNSNTRLQNEIDITPQTSSKHRTAEDQRY